eukprot:TRINITY_DN76152_c0_g1_i1.p1 TRINITY_DN76152_c0_g1~~TRINITY_DN76152_c0_g1_i1.p1  ORF type:complete len:205 (+),score=30.45 TRINITY_DN76152_c0_g1_i1:288-902(+)
MPSLASKSKLAKAGTKAAAKKPRPKVDATKKPETNAAFKRRYGLTYGDQSGKSSDPDDPACTQRNASGYCGLKRLEQPCYDEICRLSQAQSRSYLLKHGVVLPSSEKMTFHCWECGESMQKDGDGHRCKNGSCKSRPRLHNGNVAFTPLAGNASAGWELDWQMLLRASYGIACKIPLDSAVHMLRRSTDAARYAEDMIGAFTTR